MAPARRRRATHLAQSSFLKSRFTLTRVGGDEVSISRLPVRLAAEGPVNFGLIRRRAGAIDAQRHDLARHIAEIGAESGSVPAVGDAAAGRHAVGAAVIPLPAWQTRPIKGHTTTARCRYAYTGKC